MNILVYFSGKLLESKGTPIRTRNQIAQLSQNGATVFYAGHDVPEEVGVKHTLLLSGPVSRIFQIVSFIQRNNIDLVYFQTSAGLWYAPFVSFFTKAKVGVDFHSRRFQEEHVYKKRTKVLTDFLESIELFFCRFLVFGTSVAGTITDYYKKVVPEMLTLPVGVDTQLFSPSVPVRPDIVAWKGDSILLAYAGNTKWYQGVETVLEAFEKMHKAQPRIFKFLVIASWGVEDVRTYAFTHGLEDVMMVLDQQPHTEIPSLLSAADILTVVRPSDMVTEFSFPSKLPEYAALGKVLLVSRVSDIESYIKDGENGIVVNPSDIRGVEDALYRLEDANLRTILGANARALAENRFDLNVLGHMLYTFLEKIHIKH